MTRPWARAALCAGFVGWGAVLGAQPAPPPLAATAQRNACVQRRSVLDADAVPGLGRAQPVALVPVEGGALLAWLDTRGVVWAVSLDAEGVALGAPQRVAEGASQMAVARTPTGFAFAWVEGSRAVVLARRNARLEGQNVPRLVYTAPEGESVAALQLGALREALVLVWAQPTARVVMALTTDTRGVPDRAAVQVAEGASPRLVRLPESDTTALLVEQPGGTAALTLGGDLSTASRLRWPTGAVGPVELNAAVYTVQPMVTGQLLLMRAHTAGGIPATMPDLSAAPGLRPLGAHGAAGVVLARAREPRGDREVLVRLFPDGSSTRLGPFRGWRDDEPVTVGPDGVAWALQREGAPHGAARPSVLRVQCPR